MKVLKKRIHSGPDKSNEIDSSSSTPQKNGKFTLHSLKQRPGSRLNSPVWRLILAAAAFSLSAWIVNIVFGIDHWVPMIVTALPAFAAWVLAVRMLLLDCRGKKFWVIWLIVGFACLFVLPRDLTGPFISVGFSFIFLLFRRFRPYLHLNSRRKAVVFLIAVILSLILSVFNSSLDVSLNPSVSTAPDMSLDPSNTSTIMNFGQIFVFYSLQSLWFFWVISVFHLFFRIRLHFMKLRAKLAVSAFLLVMVPLFLVTVMGILTLYATLGESRAIRAEAILTDWAVQARIDREFLATVTETNFSYSGRFETDPDSPVPEWAEGFVSLAQDQDFTFSDWDPSETAAFLWVGSEIWMIILEDDQTANKVLRAGKVGETMLNRLSGLLRCDVRLSLSNPIMIGSRENRGVGSLRIDEDLPIQDLWGRLDGGSNQDSGGEKVSRPLWERRLYFGMSHFYVLSYQKGELSNQNILMLLEGNLANIIGEMTSEQNPLSQAVLVILLVLACLLMILELMALIFGMRITTGVTAAVRSLHRGVSRIGEGDLDTRIDIPNEDELGDLAAAFNEMAEAVKKGREEAVARERLELELNTARKIQERLLPNTMPQIPGFEIVGTSLPSQHVGGDYFDFIDLDGRHMGIVVGDVSGKGIPAALLMANLQASVHAQAIRKENVAGIVSRINDMLARSTDANMFATFFFGILDRKTSQFISTNAGHNPPILIRKEGELVRLKKGGLLIGFMPDQEYEQERVHLKPGDVLVLFTDGITEAVDSRLETFADDLFGEERLIEILHGHRKESARKIQSAILSSIAGHTGNSPQSDDITLVIIKCRA